MKSTSRMDADILKDHVVATKNQRVKRGSRVYGIKYVLDTNVLDVKFGVSIYCVLKLRDCEIGSQNTH